MSRSNLKNGYVSVGVFGNGRLEFYYSRNYVSGDGGRGEWRLYTTSMEFIEDDIASRASAYYAYADPMGKYVLDTLLE